MRYRKDNKFRKAWERATPEQRNAFREAFHAVDAHADKAKGDMECLYNSLEGAWESIYDKDEPVDLACLLYEMQGFKNHVVKAFDDLMACLGPGWLDEE